MTFIENTNLTSIKLSLLLAELETALFSIFEDIKFIALVKFHYDEPFLLGCGYI